jgi:hypothetical protein
MIASQGGSPMRRKILQNGTTCSSERMTIQRITVFSGGSRSGRLPE